MARKNERIRQFAYAGNFGYESFHQDLLNSATVLLDRALRDRLRCFRNEKTHSSVHSAGAIVLAVTGFEIWLNEIMTDLLLPTAEAQSLLQLSIPKRYERLRNTNNSDLDTVVEVRNEIVHHFPRPDPSLVPKWLPKLQVQGLLITLPGSRSDFDLRQKLSSYALAYWVFEVLERCAGDIAEGIADLHTRKPELPNFTAYRRICPPSQLEQFDQQE